MFMMCAFLYVKANSKEICEVSFPSIFQKNADVSEFVEIHGSKKWVATPVFLCGFQ